MKPSFQSIHKQAFNRILIATLSLAILLGFASYLFELETIDERVVSLAQREASVAQFAIDRFKALQALEQTEKQNLLKNFDLVELYDTQQRKLLELSTALGEEIEAYLETLPPASFSKR